MPHSLWSICDSASSACVGMRRALRVLTRFARRRGWRGPWSRLLAHLRLRNLAVERGVLDTGIAQKEACVIGRVEKCR